MNEMDEDEQIALAIRMSLGENVQIPQQVSDPPMSVSPPGGSAPIAHGSLAQGNAAPLAPTTSFASSSGPHGGEVGGPQQGATLGGDVRQVGAQSPGKMLQHNDFLHPTVKADSGHVPFAGDEDLDLNEAIRLSLLEGGGGAASSLSSPPNLKAPMGISSMPSGGPLSPGKMAGGAPKRPEGIPIGNSQSLRVARDASPPPGAPGVVAGLPDLPPSAHAKKRPRAMSDGCSSPDAKTMNTATSSGENEIQSLYKLVFGNDIVPADVERWEKSSFSFGKDIRIGLIQTQGGPCGILAAIQGQMIKNLLFGTDETYEKIVGPASSSSASGSSDKAQEHPASPSQNNGKNPSPQVQAFKREVETMIQSGKFSTELSFLTDEQRQRLLCLSLADFLEKARYVSNDYVVLSNSVKQSSQTEQGKRPELDFSKSIALKSKDAVMEFFRTQLTRREKGIKASTSMPPPGAVPPTKAGTNGTSGAPGALPSAPGAAVPASPAAANAAPCTHGILLAFVFSLILTRGISVVKDDMDDVLTPLVARFGHCSQELVNLMLYGQATSNVFDGDQVLGNPGDNMRLKGVSGEVDIGYISELEAMRYLEVGSKYKYPRYPVWMVGSPNHYTLLFGLELEVSKKSKKEQLQQLVKDEFDSIAMDKEGGLALTESLPVLLGKLKSLVSQEHLEEIYSILGSDDIFIWNDLWNLVKGHCLKDSEATDNTETKFTLFHYDGQQPPGPKLTKIDVESCDIPAAMAGQDDDAFTGTLKTRWKNFIFTVA